ncbi:MULTISPECIES: CII family transcriptional regulator [Pseudomonas]|nr:MULTISPECIES: CII family transcriptional regulator [Pseudomonas]
MSTTQLSPDQLQRSRKNYSAIMQRLTSVGNAPVAMAVGVDEATISRMKPEQFERFAQILAFLDLKIVPTEMRSFNENDIEALFHLARRWMEHTQNIDQLGEE